VTRKVTQYSLNMQSYHIQPYVKPLKRTVYLSHKIIPYRLKLKYVFLLLQTHEGPTNLNRLEQEDDYTLVVWYEQQI
jgi:hypothetical protein